MGKAFQEFLHKKQIKHFAATSPDVKAAIAERYIRTFKTRLWKYFTQKGTYHYLDFMPKLVHAINNSYHRTIKCTPAQVNVENEREIWQLQYGKTRKRSQVKFKFNINDTVRISREKHQLEKGYRPNFSREIFTIAEQLERQPAAYRLKDENEEVIEGIFYDAELVKVIRPDPNVYLIEKVLKSKKQHGKLYHYVKWIGHSAAENSWVQDEDLVTI